MGTFDRALMAQAVTLMRLLPGRAVVAPMVERTRALAASCPTSDDVPGSPAVAAAAVHRDCQHQQQCCLLSLTAEIG